MVSTRCFGEREERKEKGIFKIERESSDTALNIEAKEAHSKNEERKRGKSRGRQRMSVGMGGREAALTIK